MTRSKIALLSALAALTALSMQPSYAGSQEITYVAGPFIRISNASVPVGVGGYAFTPPSKPTKVTVTDSNGEGVLFTLCQENEQTEGEIPSNCGGEGDDVSLSLCSKNAGTVLGTNGANTFKANSSITVFVATIDPGGDCPAIGTVGTLRLQW